MATRARLAGRYTSVQDVALVIEGVFLEPFNEKYSIQDCITNGDQSGMTLRRLPSTSDKDSLLLTLVKPLNTFEMHLLNFPLLLTTAKTARELFKISLHS